MHPILKTLTVGGRQRYWLRSYLGYPPVRDAKPNTTHYALAALQHAGRVSKLITQNVDTLHRKALSHTWGPVQLDQKILELHGTLQVSLPCIWYSLALIMTIKRVCCSNGHVTDRNMFQNLLSAANPEWKAFADELERTGDRPRTNPDGDVCIAKHSRTAINLLIGTTRRCIIQRICCPGLPSMFGT